MILLNHKWDHAILSFKIFQQLSITSKSPDPSAWPMRPNIICPGSSTPTLLPTPPSFTDFTLAVLSSFPFPKYTNVVLLWGLTICYFFINSCGSPLMSLKSLLPCYLLDEAYPHHLRETTNNNPQACILLPTSTEAIILVLPLSNVKHICTCSLSIPSYWSLSVLFPVINAMPRMGSLASICWTHE